MNKEPYKLEILQAVVKDAYRIFGRYSAPAHPLNACTMCCMTPELEQEMRKLPLAKLGRQHFYEYNAAAKGPEQAADEVLYLLPRMLELMAEGEALHHSIELAWDRVGRCPAGSFNQAEVDVLNRFALAYFECALSGQGGLLDEPLSIMLMVHIGGLDTQALMDLWAQTDDPQSTLQYVEVTYWQFWETQDYSNAFAEEQPGFRQQLKQWISSPAHRQRFAEKLMTPEFQSLAALQRPTGVIPFSTMVDAVFDQLTQ